MTERPDDPAKFGTPPTEVTPADSSQVRHADETPSEAGASGMASLRWTLPACLLAWLVPGGGHLLVGRRWRALLFGTLIAALFVGGLALDGKVYRPVSGDPLSYLAAFGASGAGSLYIVAHVSDLGEGDTSAPYHEYGNTFTLVAGLLNLLVILDAFDFALLRARGARSRDEGFGIPA